MERFRLGKEKPQMTQIPQKNIHRFRNHLRYGALRAF